MDIDFEILNNHKGKIKNNMKDGFGKVMKNNNQIIFAAWHKNKKVIFVFRSPNLRRKSAN